MNNALSDRTPQVIAAEINSIKNQTCKILLYSAIEIGRRLTEAKSMVNHGEWGKWLESSVNYSQSTAENLMRLYEEYGDQLPLHEQADANSQALGNLNYTQAVLLLGIPKEERESFITENNVQDMSTRELQQAIKERDQALKEKSTLQKALDSQNSTITQVTAERDTLKKQAASMAAVAKTHEATVKSLQQQLANAKKDSAPAERVAELERALKAAHSKLAASKIAFQLDNLSRGFEDLLKELNKIAITDPDTHQQSKSDARELVGRILEKL